MMISDLPRFRLYSPPDRRPADMRWLVFALQARLKASAEQPSRKADEALEESPIKMGLLCKSLRDGANQELWLRSLKLWAEKGSTAASSDRLWRCECLRQRGVVFWASNSLRISKMAPLSISPSSPSFFSRTFSSQCHLFVFPLFPGRAPFFLSEGFRSQSCSVWLG